MRYCLFLLTLLLSGVAFGQENSDTQASPKVYTYVQQMPQSMVDMNAYFSKHLVYPADAKAVNAEGRVILKFVVDENGKVQNVTVLRSVYPSIDSEAVRLLKEMPNWKPGMQDGKHVSVNFQIPVTFSLNGK